MFEVIVILPDGQRKIIRGYGMDTIRKGVSEIKSFSYYRLKYRPVMKQALTIMGIPV